jgi:hypothetical protein
MELNAWFAPVYATVVTGAFLATALTRPQGMHKRAMNGVWGILFTLGAAFVLSHVAGSRFATWFSFLAGVGALLGAGYAAFNGARARNVAQVLLQREPNSVSDVVGMGRTVVELVQGRLEGVGPVTSPGGILCAAYQAELVDAEEGSSPRALAHEEAAAPKLWLTAEHTRLPLEGVNVVFGGQPEKRDSQVSRSEPMLGGSALLEGAPPVDAVSIEHVAKLGESCCVVGRLSREQNAVSLSGQWDSPATLVVGDRVGAAQKLLRRSRATFVGALGLCAASAYLLAQATAS